MILTSWNLMKWRYRRFPVRSLWNHDFLFSKGQLKDSEENKNCNQKWI
jgi:hypothetical protein